MSDVLQDRHYALGQLRKWNGQGRHSNATAIPHGRAMRVAHSEGNAS